VRSVRGFTVTAFYCPTDETVYVDTDHWLRETSAEWGHAAIGTVVLAHEWTHHAQHLLGSLPQSSSDAAGAELEADCGSGAFLAWTQDQPDPLVTEQGLEAIWAFVETIALPVPGQPTPERLTPERLTMLRTGFRDGIDACSIFPPSPTAGDIGGGGPPATSTANPTIMPTLRPTATSAPMPAVVATTTPTPAAAPPNDAPRTPTGVSARFSQGNAVVTWNAAEEDERISRYEIYRNDERIGTVRSPATIYIDELPCEGGFQYRVVAIDEAGNRSALSRATETIHYIC
jgi:hypothetical protein